ncbi:hypothetical protein [Klebsiella phage vB_KpnS_Uniso31]|uniref:Uncharacterized protein n=1 Tax=Klebsiella phage vB_KpnS_Uniso31 TaxID=2951200 RepID=A0A9E7SYY7_9CAUD|nr:hypothetical protein [Klebsiella phage vB_KpnS_Uniso31]
MSGLMFLGVIVSSAIITLLIVSVVNHFWPECFHGDM